MSEYEDIPEWWNNWIDPAVGASNVTDTTNEEFALTDAEQSYINRQEFESRVAAESQPQAQTFEELLAQFRAQIEDNKAGIQEVNETLHIFDEEMEDVDREIKLLEQKKREIKSRKTKKETLKFDLSRATRQAEDEIEALRRKIALEAAAREAQEKEEARRITLDDLTSTAFWRDRALPHQLDGMHFITAAQRVICADEMGSGKTLQAIMCLDGWEAMLDSKGLILLIAPGDLCDNFMIECDKWAPERLVVNCSNLGTEGTLETLNFYGGMIESGIEKDITVLINYEILPRSKAVVNELIGWQFDTVICDEAHRLKNTETGTFRSVKKIVHSHNTCPTCGELCMAEHSSGRMDLRHMRFVSCPTHGSVEGVRSVVNYMSMTGTPILNKPEEIYASLHLCHDEIFPSLNNFRNEYCYQDWDHKWKWTTNGESRLVNKIKGMYIRRTIADAGITLPKQEIQVHDIILDATAYSRQAQILTDLIKDCQIRINDREAVGINHVMALITRQRQAAVWPGGIKLRYLDKSTGIIEERVVGDQYLESQKLDKACELMDEFDESGIRYVVFSQFREPLIELGKRRGDKCVEFHGGTDQDTRGQIMRNFDRTYLARTGEEPKWNGVLAHYKLGGEGLNLTAATQTIILDEQWNYGMANQAYKRTQRMGQTEETGIHILRLVGKGSLDQWMAELIESKQKMVDGFDTEVSFAQLAALFDQAS